MIFSVHRDGQLDLLKAIFHLRCMVIFRIVRIRVKVSVSVKRSELGFRLRLVVGLVLIGLVRNRMGDGK